MITLYSKDLHPYKGTLMHSDATKLSWKITIWILCECLPKILGLMLLLVIDRRYIEYNYLVHSSWNFMLVYNLVVILDS